MDSERQILQSNADVNNWLPYWMCHRMDLTFGPFFKRCVFFLGFVKAVTSLLTLVANLFSESLSESKACVPADFFLSLSHPGSTCIFFFFPQVNFHKLKKLTLTEELLLPVSYGESSTIVRAEHSEVKPMELIRGYSMCSTGVTTHSFKAHWLNKNPVYNMGI